MADEVAVKFTGSIEGIQTSVTQIREFLQGLEAPIRGVRSQLGELADAFIAAFAVERLKTFAEHMGEIGDQTERAAAILGTSTEDIGRLGLIAQLSGSSVDSLRSAFSQMSLRIVEQSDQTKRALAALGLSFDSLRGKSTVDQLALLADAFSQLQNGTNKTAIATALLGRAGADLIPLLNQGRDGIAKVAAEADGLGVALDKETTQALVETNRAFTLLSASIRGASIQAFLSFRGAVEGTVEIVRDLATSFTAAMKSGGLMSDLVAALAAALKGVVTVIASAVYVLKDMWAVGVFVIDAIGLDFIALGRTVSAVWSALSASVEAFFSGLLTAARETVAGVGNMFANLGAVISAALHGDLAGAREAFSTMASAADTAGKAIGQNLNRAMKGADFSSVTNEFAQNAAIMSAKSAELGATLRANDAAYVKQMQTIWGTGHKELEKEKDRHDRAMAAPGDQDAISAALKAIEGQIKAEQEGLKLKIAVWDAGVKQFAMFEQTRFGLVEQATQKEYEAEVALLKKELEIPGLKLAKQQEINNKIRELEAAHTLQMVKLDNDAIASQQQAWDGYFGHIQSAFNSQLRGLLAGTTSWAQAFKSIVSDLVIAFIQAVEKMAFQWIAAEIAKTTATTTGAAARASAEVAGQSIGVASTIANALRSIGASLGMTFAGVSANQAPLLGPAAPAEAAAVTSAVDVAAMGFLGAFDVGSWNIPRAGFGLLHPGEMVVSQPFAEGLRNSGGIGGGGDVHIHYNQVGRIPQSEIMPHARALAREIGKLWTTTDRSTRPAW